MQLFQLSDPKPLSPLLADKVGTFFKSDVCKALRTVARSRSADAIAKLGEHACQNAVDYLKQDTISAEARESLAVVSQYSIFLSVLERLEKDLLSGPLFTTEKITLDQE